MNDGKRSAFVNKRMKMRQIGTYLFVGFVVFGIDGL
jgi:hypothetical protein